MTLVLGGAAVWVLLVLAVAGYPIGWWRGRAAADRGWVGGHVESCGCRTLWRRVRCAEHRLAARK